MACSQMAAVDYLAGRMPHGAETKVGKVSSILFEQVEARWSFAFSRLFALTMTTGMSIFSLVRCKRVKRGTLGYTVVEGLV